ncbi:hypothetical protein Vadar_033616 [Vaccinium darrowii]|uniref:Uncharacterized protein n=1 Tax=Vaccinium darrowii TaxID=229202 RepID=A0ACB7YRC5_9ERIC|nr:hypothetical protein Vadar_033616 [Vaccinium darrowii]
METLTTSPCSVTLCGVQSSSVLLQRTHLIPSLLAITSQATSVYIIEGPETVQDFVQMQLQEIQDNIKSRRNKIFLLMEDISLQPILPLCVAQTLQCSSRSMLHPDSKCGFLSSQCQWSY